ncbi:MAG: hypothetical protein VR72_10750 [Clostridiaceae bacterium BRH_c20a]|nr:MAG: hypothetical protein VR72_10750 [Clostridiaceae bacterium BRH_c20a]
MAIISTALGSRLQVILQTGVDGQGNPVLKTRSYNRVKASASDENVYQFSVTIAGLQLHPLYEVNRVNEVSLEQI